MNGDITSKTELQILASAEKLFLQKGFRSTSTTDIARDAGCNQAMIHYYFRTKENLFNRIFHAKFETVMDFIDRSLRDDKDIFGNLQCIIGAYFDFLSDNPRLSYFILEELAENPQRRKYVRTVFLASPARQQVYSRFRHMVGNAVQDGEIRDIDPIDLILDGISLVAFSFISAPIFSDLLGRDPGEARAYLDHRRDEVTTLLLNGLRPLAPQSQVSEGQSRRQQRSGRTK